MSEFIEKLINNKKLLFVFMGAVGGIVGSLISEIPSYLLTSFIFDVPSKFGGVIGTISFTVPSVIVICLGLFWAEEISRRSQRLLKSLIPAVVLAGAIAGAIGGGVAQIIFSFADGYVFFQNFILRPVCWGIMGVIVGAWMSRAIPNLELKRGSLGGLFGGILGGIGFLFVIIITVRIGVLSPLASEVFGRFIGMGVTGAFLGLAVVLVEQITRSAYIKVYWGPKQQSQVTLGPQPVLIGSSSQAHITIPSKSIASIAGAVVLLDKKIELEDRVAKSTRLLNIGDRLEYAHVTIEICSGKSNAGEPPVIYEPSAAGEQSTKEASSSKSKIHTHSKTLTLIGEGGRSTGLKMRTKLNKHNLKQFGPDSQFADSDFQYELLPEGESWCIVPNGRAKNETLLNGHSLNDKTNLAKGDQISIGREAKGVSKLELKIHF